ncbi:ABC transporter permease [Diplocloster hominis]|uniref:ABC transporter permease n=1 Tax=Diplocloster hominis TaxID=3079010 RepID=UPI0031BAAE3B
MRNQYKAEWYKFHHSKMPFIILGVCISIILASFAFGNMTFFGAGDGITNSIGFQAKCYLSEETPTFISVARSALAYTAFFWMIGVLFTALFFTKEYSQGTIKLSVAYGMKRSILYYTKAITIFVISFLTYFAFVAVFTIVETMLSGYFLNTHELIKLLGWTSLCGMVLIALECITIFFCVLIPNTGIVTGICFLYVFSGASVYLMIWSEMEKAAIPMKIFIYGNPMFYWMNFSSCRTMGIVENLPFYIGGCILLLIIGSFVMNKKEIK